MQPLGSLIVPSTILSAILSVAGLALPARADPPIRIPFGSLLQQLPANQVLRVPGFRARGNWMTYNCRVWGTPSEFPNDIQVWHPTLATPAGTVVRYHLPIHNVEGQVVLPALAPGQRFGIYNIIPGGQAAGNPCSAIEVLN